SHGYDPDSAYTAEFVIHDLHLLTDNIMPEHDITFKIRHTADINRATIEHTGDGRYRICSEKPIHGVAPGQFCVIYDSDHHRCFGSGEITL
ncbi:MAG: tRNA 2-thiouridine(34) synthase MnmA, partial [Prevotella sp.]|nr:tRNA 2-thiouridine(34) synthase MnmA [Prevotella sp.]